MSTATEPLLTLEDFLRLPDPGYPTELVRGKVVRMPSPTPRHGEICGEVARLLGNHVKGKLGRVVVNDAGVVTERDPDSVRGPDVAYYSYTRVPPGPLPLAYMDAVPELVFEVRSPSDRAVAVLAKVTELLQAGVGAVCVLDPRSQTFQIYLPDELPRTLHGDDEFALPELLGDFRVPVRQFFE